MMVLPTMLLAGLEAALNRYLALDPAAGKRFAALAGKVIGVELRGLDLVFYMAPHAGGIRLLGDYAGTPHTVIAGAPFSLLRLARAQGERSLLFQGAVEVRGDVELGQRFEAILRDIDIDWEEQLSHLVGDVAAHRIGVAVRGARDYGTQAAGHLRRDVADYLQEESAQLPRRDEVDEFVAAVDSLRGDADRLAARVQRLAAWHAQRGEA